MQAVYSKHPDPVLNGNPLTEALTVMLKREEVIKNTQASSNCQ